MARGNRRTLVINSQYQPFSFQERLAPLQIAQNAYDTTQAGLMQLDEDANAMQNYINPTSNAYRRLSAYNQRLTDAADKLASEGLRSINKGTLLNLRKEYNDDIKKINGAAAQLAEMTKAYQQAEMKAAASGDRLFSSGVPDIDTLIANPQAAPYTISATGLYNHGVAAAKTASSQRTGHSIAADKIAQGYYHIINTQGYNSRAAQEFIANAASHPELQKIYEDVRSMYDVDRVQESDAANATIMRGILDGMIYDRKDNYIQDPLAKAGGTGAIGGITANLPVNVRPFYTQNERTQAAKDIDRVSKLFTTDARGNFIFKPEKEDEVREKLKKGRSISFINSPTGAYYADNSVYSDSPSIRVLRRMMEETGTDDPVEAYRKFYADHKGELPDARRLPEYQYAIDDTSSKDWENALASIARDGKLFEVKYDKKNDKFIEGKKYKASDLAGNGVRVTEFRGTRLGNVVTVLDKNNDKHELLMPKGYNPRIDRKVEDSIYNMGAIQDDMKDFMARLGYDETTDPAQLGMSLLQSANEQAQAAGAYLLQLYNEYVAEQQSFYAYSSQYGNTFKNKPTDMPGFNE